MAEILCEHKLDYGLLTFQVLKDPKKPTKKSNFWRVRYEKVSCIVMRDIAAIQYHLRGVTGSMEMAPLHPSTRLGSFAGMEGVSSSKVEGFYGHQGMMTSSPVIDVGTSGAEGEGIAASAGSAARSTKDYRDNKKFKKNPKNGKAFLMESILKTPFQEKEQVTLLFLLLINSAPYMQSAPYATCSARLTFLIALL